MHLIRVSEIILSRVTKSLGLTLVLIMMSVTLTPMKLVAGEIVNITPLDKRWSEIKDGQFISVSFVNMCCGIDQVMYSRVVNLISSDPDILQAYQSSWGLEPSIGIIFNHRDPSRLDAYFDLISKWIPKTSENQLMAIVNYKDKRVQTIVITDKLLRRHKSRMSNNPGKYSSRVGWS